MPFVFGSPSRHLEIMCSPNLGEEAWHEKLLEVPVVVERSMEVVNRPWNYRQPVRVTIARVVKREPRYVVWITFVHSEDGVTDGPCGVYAENHRVITAPTKAIVDEMRTASIRLDTTDWQKTPWGFGGIVTDRAPTPSEDGAYRHHLRGLERLHRVAEIRNRGGSAKEIEVEVGVSRSTAFRLLKEAREAGLLEEEGED